MESDLAAISCLIVLGVMLTCACSYLCTEAYSVITRIDDNNIRAIQTLSQRRRMQSLQLQQRSTNFYTEPETLPRPRTARTSTIVNTGLAPAPTSSFITQNLSTTTTTVVSTGQEIVRAETQQLSSGGQQPDVPPPPLPPRPRPATMFSPWTLVPSLQTHNALSQAGQSQLITFRDRRNTDDFQYPPHARPMSMAVHFQNHAAPPPVGSGAGAGAGRPSQQLVNLAREYNRHGGGRGNVSGMHGHAHGPASPGYRQTMSSLADLHLGRPIWLEQFNHGCELDLPPTYDEAMEMEMSVMQSQSTRRETHSTVGE